MLNLEFQNFLINTVPYFSNIFFGCMYTHTYVVSQDESKGCSYNDHSCHCKFAVQSLIPLMKILSDTRLDPTDCHVSWEGIIRSITVVVGGFTGG